MVPVAFFNDGLAAVSVGCVVRCAPIWSTTGLTCHEVPERPAVLGVVNTAMVNLAETTRTRRLGLPQNSDLAQAGPTALASCLAAS
jgi:hypothetical protein